MNWAKQESDLYLTVPCMGCVPDEGNGEYKIIIAKRPHYCDRGDWLIYLDGINNDIDHQDGFPRYFIGSEEEVKQQMEKWLMRRSAYRNWLKQQTQ